MKITPIKKVGNFRLQLHLQKRSDGFKEYLKKAIIKQEIGGKKKC